jgi:hypothetical protein
VDRQASRCRCRWRRLCCASRGRQSAMALPWERPANRWLPAAQRCSLAIRRFASGAVASRLAGGFRLGRQVQAVEGAGGAAQHMHVHARDQPPGDRPQRAAGNALARTGMALARTGMALARTGMALARTGMALARTGMALARRPTATCRRQCERRAAPHGPIRSLPVVARQRAEHCGTHMRSSNRPPSDRPRRWSRGISSRRSRGRRRPRSSRARAS